MMVAALLHVVGMPMMMVVLYDAWGDRDYPLIPAIVLVVAWPVSFPMVVAYGALSSWRMGRRRIGR